MELRQIKNFRSIIYNLLSNVIKFHSPNRQPVIKISCFMQNEYKVIEIEDKIIYFIQDEKVW